MTNAKHPKTQPDVIVWLAALSVVAIQAQLFLTGYRLAADDVLSHYLALQGFDALMEHASTTAKLQGRVGMHVMLPLNGLASYLSDYYVFRIVSVALHFGTMFLAATFVSLLLRREVRLFMFLVLVVLHPLDFHHLPPNTYALQNSVPFIPIFLARIWLWKRRDKQPAPHWPGLLFAYSVFSIAMLFNEFSTVLGATLLLAEHMSLICSGYRRSGSLPTTIAAAIASRRLWLDALSLGATLGAYVLFRVLNPSSYNGNSLDGLQRLPETWITLYRHIASGTIFTRLGETLQSDLAAPTGILVAAAVVGMLSLLFFARVEKPKLRLDEMALTILVSAFVAILLTLPIAGVIKYQDWCLRGFSCAYLDSRMSLYPVGASIVAICLAAISLARTGFAKKLSTAAIALVLAVLSSVTYLTNWHKEQAMDVVVSGWDRASAITCVPDLAAVDTAEIVNLIDPVPNIYIHLGHSIEDYWQRYLQRRKSQLDCDNLPSSVMPWLRRVGAHNVELNQVLSFAIYEHGMALASGWNGPEPWGVWSEDEIAEIRVVPGSENIRTLAFRFHVYPPPTSHGFVQSIGVVINGQKHADWSLEPRECGARVIRLVSPLPVGRKARIAFEIASPTSPKSIGMNKDTRRLGIGLISMTAADWSEAQAQAWQDRQCQ